MGFEGALAVARHLDGQFAELALERLPALAVASVAAGVDHRFVSVVAEVLGQFGVQRLFYQQLGQLLEQAVLADQVFRFLVISQQFRQQFFRDFVFLGCHCAYGHADLRLRWIVRLHKILHTLAPSKRRSLAATSPTAVIASGSKVGLHSKLRTDYGWTFQMIHRCASHTKPSTKPCTSRVEVPSSERRSVICAPGGRYVFLGQGAKLTRIFHACSQRRAQRGIAARI